MKAWRQLTAGAILAGAAVTATAQDFPTKPIRLIVPFGPGGTTDILARVVGERLGERFGQQVLIDNRPGAGGNIAAEIVARAAPDGYTIFLGSMGTQSINISTWYGILAPAATPKEIVAKLNDALVQIIKTPATNKRLLELGVDPVSNTPEQFSALIRTDLVKWAKVAKNASIRVN